MDENEKPGCGSCLFCRVTNAFTEWVKEQPEEPDPQMVGGTLAQALFVASEMTATPESRQLFMLGFAASWNALMEERQAAQFPQAEPASSDDTPTKH